MAASDHRTVFIDMMVERADKNPHNMLMQEEMLHPRISWYLTNTERNRFKRRLWRNKDRKARNLVGAGIQSVIRIIDDL